MSQKSQFTPVCVKMFKAWVKFSRINAKNYLRNLQNSGYSFQKTGVSAQKLWICSKYMSKTSTILDFWPKISRFTRFSWVKLKILGIYWSQTWNTIADEQYTNTSRIPSTTPKWTQGYTLRSLAFDPLRFLFAKKGIMVFLPIVMMLSSEKVDDVFDDPVLSTSARRLQ